MDNVSMEHISAKFETLESLNDIESKVRLPAIIFQSIMIVVGVVGNFFVWLIYGYRMKKRSTHRNLVLGKAVYDTLACCFGIPGNIVDLSNPFTFYSSAGCKLLRFGYHVLAVGSAMSHFLNGIDRYRRICYPLAGQMSTKVVKYMLIMTFVLSFILVSPTLAFYDSVDAPTGVSGLSGRQCSQSNKWINSLVTLVFEIILSVLVLANVTTLMIFYTMIGRKLCKRESLVSSMATHSVKHTDTPAVAAADAADKVDGEVNRKVEDIKDVGDKQSTSESERNHENRLSEPFPEHPVTKAGGIHQESVDKDESFVGEQNDFENRRNRIEVAKGEPTHKYAKDNNGRNVLDIVRQMQIRKTSLRNTKSRKLTLITFLLAIIFVLSYFPIIVLALFNNLDSNKLEELSPPLKRTYFVFLVSYTIGNVSNPLVYLAIDDEFRHQIKLCFSNVYAKCKMINV